MSTILTFLALAALTVTGSVVAVCLVLLVAERSEERRKK